MAAGARRCRSTGRRASGNSQLEAQHMEHRLIAVVVVAVMVSGCAAGRAFRRGEDASRNGNWDVAVAEYTKAVQADPDKPEYKIQLQRAMQSAAQAHISLAREMEEKDALDAALIEYRRASELD